MAWQRKIPFGYTIEGGVTQPHPQEANAVRYIFGQYLAGASLLAIAEDMTEHGPRYHQHTSAWNKNMVKRILENAKYTGAEGYPPLVSNEDFAAARCQRSSRNTYAPLSAKIRPILGKMVCAQCGSGLARGTRSHGRVQWRCHDCGQSVSIGDEALAEMVNRRLRELSQAPHLLTAPKPQQAGPDLDVVRLQNELTLSLNWGIESPEYIKSLALAAAVQRYSQLPDPTPAHELERLRTRLEQGTADTEGRSMVKMYADKGITGTSAKKRPEFLKMIRDAEKDKIDLVITKSVSRFIRNTLDGLEYVRRLKRCGVGAYFEKENTNILNMSNEMILTFMMSQAQSESESLSTNVKWGFRKRFQDGVVYYHYDSFLGYREGPDGQPEIDPDQAPVVRRIFARYLMGHSVARICRDLMEDGVPTARGGEKWCDTTVRNILQNEKYIGDAILQKTFSADLFDDRQQIKSLSRNYRWTCKILRQTITAQAN